MDKRKTSIKSIRPRRESAWLKFYGKISSIRVDFKFAKEDANKNANKNIKKIKKVIDKWQVHAYNNTCVVEKKTQQNRRKYLEKYSSG